MLFEAEARQKTSGMFIYKDRILVPVLMGLLINFIFFDFYKVAQFLNALDDFRKILRAPEARQCGEPLKFSGLSVPFCGMLGRGAQKKTIKTVTTVTFLHVLFVHVLAPRGAWLRQESCQEISCSRSGGIKEVSFV